MGNSSVMFVVAAVFAADSLFAAFRPPAVPLVSVEPHFSVWSAADRLYDKDTTHWTGRAQPLTILLDADGVTYRLCGRGTGKVLELPVLPQTECRVGATVTSYRFADGKGISAEVDFTTPRLTDDLDVFSRPVTYLTVRVKGAKTASVRASIAGAWATNDDAAKTLWTTNTYVEGVRDISVCRADAAPFSIRGDHKRANWGRVHLVGPLTSANYYLPSTNYHLPSTNSQLTTTFLLAYDNGKSVRFFGEELVDWWARGGKPFYAMLAEAVLDAARIEAKCRDFDAKFRADMERIGGVKYADIAELAWRQSFAACKFVAGPGGEPFMFSAENDSGGMIGTTDVFYPQFPHLLMSSLALAKATLAPTCIYAASTNWPYAYAPHDLGLFPVAEGQYYGMKKGQSVGGGTDDTYRMPVEECGNMLILLASVAKAEGNADFAGRWWGEVTKWAKYLERFGYDPGNQLCTDDFAGHLAHNANLSVKSIVALASYAEMAKMRGEVDVAKHYRALAEEMVPKWIEAAKGGAHGGTRIAFDRPGTWSLKYNLVWDRVLGLGLFPPEVAAAELKAYRAVVQPYGVPLDCRKTYTKADWIVWCGALTGRREDLEFMCEGLHRFLDETPDRIAFGDWYMADSGLYRGFIARSVVGGVFMPALAAERNAKKRQNGNLAGISVQEERAQPLLGVDFVRWDGMPCERMGWRRPYEEHNAASYASRKEWEDETLARLKSWGFNMLGANCDDSLRHKGLSHTIFLNMSEGFCTGDDDRWISRYANVPNTALPNVFHPDFAAHCDTVAREMCAANRGDADLLGYYIDNELVWQGSRGAPLDTGLFDTVRGKRERHSARLALLAFLRKEGVADFAAYDALPPERRKRLKTAFTEFFSERYFSVTTGAIRRHDSSHRILGCRFAGMDGAPPEVWKMAGRFCDVITFNCYPWADLDRNVVLDARGGVPVAKRFAAIHELTGRPLFISEWSFPALDAGCPCRNGAGQRFRTQAERVRASELFARTMLAQPFVLGYSFFMWIDQPALGTNGDNPEDSNYGLVSEKGVPYAGLTDMFRRLHGEVRDGSSRPKMPEECHANPLPARSMRDKFLAEAKGDASDVRFCRNGDEWRLSNSSGLTLYGKIGGKDMVGEVRLGQCLFGRYGGMIQMVTQGGDSRWILADDVKSVDFEREGVCGTLIIVAAGKSGECSFNLTHRVTVAPGRRNFLCEVAGIENTGNLAFAVRRFYTCPFAAESRPDVRAGVQNVWKGTRECYWQMSEGRSYGMASTDDTADWFNLWIDGDGRQHPDIDFSLASSLHLAPGKSQSPPRPMTAIAFVDGAREYP